MGVTALMSGAGRWLRDNLVGGTRDFLDNDGAKKHRDGIEDADKKLDDWRKDLDRIDQDSKIQPPRLQDISARDLVVMGGTAGAVVGLGAGSLSGLANSWLNDTTVEVTWTEHRIQDQVLKGYTDTLTPDVDRVPVYDGNGNVVAFQDNVKGHHHAFTPQIETKDVGEWREPHASISRDGNGGSAVAEGLKGMVVGGLVGAGVGAVVAVARRATGQSGQPARPPRQVDDQGKVIAVCAGGGAVIGAGVGLVSGLLEKADAVSQTVEWEAPVMEQKTIGQIPQDHYHSIFETRRESDIARRDVVVEGPKMERGLFGMKPDLQDRSLEVAAEPRYSLAGQVVGGAVLGTMGGVAAGVAVNVVRKYI